jgi:predicted kinase
VKFWNELDAWQLPGPAKFLLRVRTLAMQPSGGMCLLLPDPMPQGVLEAAADFVRVETGLRVMVVDVSEGTGQRGPAHWLAARSAVDAIGIRSAADFLDEPDLFDAVFIVHGLSRKDWRGWANFVRLLRAEARTARAAAPAVIVVPPVNIPQQEIHAVFGRDSLTWTGRIGRLDTEMMVARATMWSADDDLASRAAAACVAEVSGWDLHMARALSSLSVERRLNPLDDMRPQVAEWEDIHPTWENGLVDLWDGGPFEHSLSLIRRGREADVLRRIWRARVRVVFPFIEQVRSAVTRRFRNELLADGPVVKTFNSGKTVTLTDPEQFEFWDIHNRLKRLVPEQGASFLWLCYRIRNNLAHMDPATVEHLISISRYWEENSHSYLDDCHGWDWPRCGQKLMVLVGPSGAGKSTWAGQNCDIGSVVSSDAIRERLFGSIDAAGDQEPVFDMLRQETIRLLAAGRTAVIDATNLDSRHRIANAMIAPPDMRVEYVIVDRPMDQKVATQGWRASKPWLMAKHAKDFEAALPQILARDGLRHVELRDGGMSGEKRPTNNPE